MHTLVPCFFDIVVVWGLRIEVGVRGGGGSSLARFG